MAHQKILFSDKKILLESPKYKKTGKVVFKQYSQDQEFLLPKNIDEIIKTLEKLPKENE